MPSAEPVPSANPPRRVIVLGAGVVGITTAYMLHRAGCEVTLVETEATSATGASHANGGQLSYSHAEPWANPHTLRQLPRWLVQKHSPLSVNWQFDPELWCWIAKFAVACTQSQRSALALLQLASYSRNLLENIIEQTQIHFDYKKCGTVHLCRSMNEFEHAQKQARWQEEVGQCRFERWDVETTLTRLPAMRADAPLSGALFFPDDAAGNAALYCRNLAQYMSNNGLSIYYNEEIISIQYQNNCVTHLITRRGEVLQADAVVLCNGVMAGKSLGSLRRYIPLQPMQGYSLSYAFNQLPFNDLSHAMTDGDRKMVYSPLGHVLRIAGMGTVGAWGREAPEERIRQMRSAAAEWLGPEMLEAEATAWCGLRPATPNGLPFIGRVPGFGNLFGNFGHGTLGWTLAPGSAALLRDQLLGVTPEVSAEPFSIP